MAAFGRCCCKSLEGGDLAQIVNIFTSSNSANVLILLSLDFERAWKIHDFQSVEDFCNSIGTKQPKRPGFQVVRCTPDSGPFGFNVGFPTVFVCS
jgi:hypothetical protein